MSNGDEYAKQRRHELHAQNLSKGGENTSQKAEILRELSEIDDLPIAPADDPVMGQLISKLTSTANLSAEEVRSNEWVREYILVLYLCKQPKPNGLCDEWRGLAHGDMSEERDPLNPDQRAMLETLVSSSSRLALSRSEDAKVIEEGARTINESVTRDSSETNGGSGGILGRLKS